MTKLYYVDHDHQHERWDVYSDFQAYDGAVWHASFASREHAERFAAELNAAERCPCGAGSRDDDHACGLARPERRDPTSKQRRLSEKPGE